MKHGLLGQFINSGFSKWYKIDEEITSDKKIVYQGNATFEAEGIKDCFR